MASHKRILRSLGNNGPTKRNLFGPVDRERLQLEYQESLRKDLEDASRRWDFDFFSEKPVDGGDFQWENLEKTPQKQRDENGKLKRKQTNITDFYPAKRKVSASKIKRKQTNITDFYQANRRVLENQMPR